MPPSCEVVAWTNARAVAGRGRAGGGGCWGCGWAVRGHWLGEALGNDQPTWHGRRVHELRCASHAMQAALCTPLREQAPGPTTGPMWHLMNDWILLPTQHCTLHNHSLACSTSRCGARRHHSTLCLATPSSLTPFLNHTLRPPPRAATAANPQGQPQKAWTPLITKHAHMRCAALAAGAPAGSRVSRLLSCCMPRSTAAPPQITCTINKPRPMYDTQNCPRAGRQPAFGPSPALHWQPPTGGSGHQSHAQGTAAAPS